MNKIEEIYQGFLSALCSGQDQQALAVAQAALAQGIDFHDLYIQVFQRALYEFGRLWEAGQVTSAQEHLATAITRRVMGQIYAQVTAQLTPRRMFMSALGRTMVASCPAGEYHDLGLRMVSDFLEREGWHVYYLGANVPSEDILQMVRSQRPRLVALSSTLHQSLMPMRDLIQAIRTLPDGAHIKVLIGGQAVQHTPDLTARLGADHTACDAREALYWVLEGMN